MDSLYALTANGKMMFFTGAISIPQRERIEKELADRQWSFKHNQNEIIAKEFSNSIATSFGIYLAPIQVEHVFRISDATFEDDA